MNESYPASYAIGSNDAQTQIAVVNIDALQTRCIVFDDNAPCADPRAEVVHLTLDDLCMDAIGRLTTEILKILIPRDSHCCFADPSLMARVRRHLGPYHCYYRFSCYDDDDYYYEGREAVLDCAVLRARRIGIHVVESSVTQMRAELSRDDDEQPYSPSQPPHIENDQDMEDEGRRGVLNTPPPSPPHVADHSDTEFYI